MANAQREVPPAELIDALILAYRPDLVELRRCVESVLDEPRARVVLAINNDDRSVGEAVRRAVADLDRTTIVELGRNWGYAAGINLGLAHCRSELVMLLNDDAVPEASAIEALAGRLRRSPSAVVGVCPKLVFADRPGIIDACGSATTSRAATYNRGAGEPDLGQYDHPHEVAAACFAAVLLRRAAFEPSDVGPLAEPYFMYCEDADWCLRARLRGHRFEYEPTAVVHHVHSASTSALPAAWKLDLIDRNSWLMAVRCLPAPGAVFVVVARLARHGRRLLLGPERGRSVRLLVGVAARLPWALRTRAAYRGGLLRSHPADAHLRTLGADVGHGEARDPRRVAAAGEGRRAAG